MAFPMKGTLTEWETGVTNGNNCVKFLSSIWTVAFAKTSKRLS